MQFIGGMGLFVSFLAIGAIQIYVGFLGIEFHLGEGWAWGAIAVGFIFRLMLPLTVGTFFGAMDVWGWPWYGALLIAAPGLLFVLPATITAAFQVLRDR
jgi:hypothetical protein